MGRTKAHNAALSTATTTNGRKAFRYSSHAGVVAPLNPPIRQSRIRNSHQIKLVRYAVESVGSKVIGDAVMRGDDAFIRCNADSGAETLLRSRLMATSIGCKMHRFSDDQLWIQFRDKHRAPRFSLPKDVVLKIGLCVQEMCKELRIIRDYMRAEAFEDARVPAGPEELCSLLRRQFQELTHKYKNFQIFIAIETSPELKAKLMNKLPGSRQFILLAKEFAAAITGEPLATIKEAWYQFPRLSKTPKIQTN